MAPQWLKTPAGAGLGSGTLDDSDRAFAAYATYLVRTAAGFAAAGAPLAFLTLQNEPEHGGCGAMPCMRLSAVQAARLGLLVQAGLRSAGLGETTRLLAYDHNWDDIEYPRSLLSNGTAPYDAARAFAGVAWHCYGGDVSAQATLHDEFAAARPDLETHMTECSGGDWAPDWGGNLLFQQKSLLIGGVNAWSSSVLLWNLFLDDQNGPHCEGGACCTGCRPVVTVPGGAGVGPNASSQPQLARHEEYYGLAHHSAFVRPGARRVAATVTVATGSGGGGGGGGGDGDVIAVAYAGAGGETTLVVANTQPANVTLEVSTAAGGGGSDHNDGAGFSFVLPQGVATFVW
jgi:glucosylceramidase